MLAAGITMHVGLMLVSGVVAGASLARLYAPARGTTLMAVWFWSAMGFGAVLAAEIAMALFIRQPSGSETDAIRFAADSIIFCPAVALFGAKRPQDRAWQLIVLSFWVILALPALEALLLRPGQPLAVHPIWSGFLVVLIVVGASNYLPTRYAFAAVLAAAGQALLVWQELPGSGWLESGTGMLRGDRGWMPSVGLALLALAAATAAFGRRRSAPASDPLKQLWRDFCDQFGVVWGLRVAERVNTTAAQNRCNVRLTWHGITSADAELPARQARPSAAELENLRQALLPLVRRFVSADWIARRIGSEDAALPQ